MVFTFDLGSKWVCLRENVCYFSDSSSKLSRMVPYMDDSLVNDELADAFNKRLTQVKLMTAIRAPGAEPGERSNLRLDPDRLAHAG